MKLKAYTYMYHPDGQLARANYGGKSEEFLWDGLALVCRNDEHFINEPHVGGGNPVASSKGKSYFNDILGTTVGFKTNGKYSAAALTAFGEDLTVHSPTPTQNSNFFTGKPYVEGLGHAFLMRNYRAGLAKWQSADPLGYPDGWNQLAYCNNGVTSVVDLWGAKVIFLNIKEIWRAEFGEGSVGYPVFDLFSYMKDKWEYGVAIMGLLGITNVESFLQKTNEKINDELENRIKEILDTGLWFEVLLKSIKELGYVRETPSSKGVQREFYKLVPDGEFIRIESMELVRVVPDYQKFSGQKFIHGCDLIWKVKVIYE